MARRSTYVASLAPVALFLAAMVSADGGSDAIQPSAEASMPVQVAENAVAPRPAERVQISRVACADTQSCYDAQVRRLQEAAFY